MGSGFLCQSEDTWPTQPINFDPTLTDDLEVQKKSYATRFVCWMLRLKKNLHIRSNSNVVRNANVDDIEPITVAEMKVAEMKLLKFLQTEHYQDELASLKAS